MIINPGCVASYLSPFFSPSCSPGQSCKRHVKQADCTLSENSAASQVSVTSAICPLPHAWAHRHPVSLAVTGWEGHILSPLSKSTDNYAYMGFRPWMDGCGIVGIRIPQSPDEPTKISLCRVPINSKLQNTGTLSFNNNQGSRGVFGRDKFHIDLWNTVQPWWAKTAEIPDHIPEHVAPSVYYSHMVSLFKWLVSRIMLMGEWKAPETRIKTEKTKTLHPNQSCWLRNTDKLGFTLRQKRFWELPQNFWTVHDFLITVGSLRLFEGSRTMGTDS